MNSVENYPDWLLTKWQEIANLLAEIFSIPAALIMKTDKEFMEVFISSKTKDNPYHVGDSEKWHGLYCETVIKSQNKLLISNALKDENWNNNPDIKLGMISYLGYPINYPDNRPFGTICILDKKENKFSEQIEKLMLQFKNVIEQDLSILQTYDKQTESLYSSIENLKITENLLIQRETELKKIQAITHIGSWYLDIETGNVTWTEELFKMFGIDSTLPPPPYSEHKNFFTPDSWNLLSNSLSKTQETGIPYELELQTVKVDGTYRWMWVRGEVVKNNDGKVIGLWGAAQDISERKIFEKELLHAKNKAEENEIKFSKLFYISPEPQTVTSLKDGRILMVNDAFLINSGFEIEEVINHTSIEINSWLSIDDRNKWVEELQKTGKVRSLEIPFRTKKYGIREYIVSSDLIELDGEKCTLNFYLDITERKRIENELKNAKEKAEDSERNYKLIFNSTDTSNSIFDTNGILLLQNDLSKKTLGRGDNDGIGKTVTELFGNERGAIILERMMSVIDNKTNAVFETEFNLPSGRKWFRSTYLPMFDNNNNVISIQIISQDITEMKETEKELIKAKERAEESDRLKTAFLQNMSHEIRTPLNAICGFADFLSNSDLPTEKRMNFVSIVQNSSKQLLSIVTDILTISSLETKQEKVRIDSVCINNIIMELHTIFKQQIENRNISLHTKIAVNDSLSIILTDKTKVTQILSNLLTNAIKFTQSGIIEFGYTFIKIDGFDFMKFYVKDSGIGIREEHFDQIFERFRQAEQSENVVYGGTGLGLAISKAFVELLGGNIWVESEIDKGSTFYFTIPYNSVNDVHKEDSKQEGIMNNSTTILIAEDEDYNFLFIQEVLLETKVNIIHSKDGQETVDICKRNNSIDLVLMDIKMPVLNGYEAAKQIKEFRPELPIIAQSAYALEHEKAVFENIFDEYLTKPIEIDVLKEVLAKFIKRK